MSGKTFSNVIGIDDAPFAPSHRGDVSIVGMVYSGERLDGVVSGKVRRDGADANRRVAAMIEDSKFAPQLQLVMFQGIALAGFNVLDIESLHLRLGLPILVVTRRRPDLDAIRDALLGPVPGGRRKWGLIEKLDPMEPLENVYVQRVGLSRDAARQVLRRFTHHGHIPEPLRTAHLVAGGMATGESRGRA